MSSPQPAHATDVRVDVPAAGAGGGAGAGAGNGGDGSNRTARADPYCDESLPFLTLKPGSREQFEIGEQAARMLEAIPGRIMIVGLVGKMRTGKSFILNRLCGHRAGFKVGPTTSHCTEGLWIWGRPIEVTKDGEKLHVVLLDSEGMGRPGAEAEHDARVFSLAALLSSLLVYNCMAEIDNSSIEYLALIVNIARRIAGMADDASATSELSHDFQPSFLWLIRDFALRAEDKDGRPMTAKQYMESQLAPRQSRSDEARKQNHSRKFIDSYFPPNRRTCFFMSRPISSEKKLANAEEADFDTDMVPKFKEQIAQLKDLIFNKHATVKQVGGRDVTGRMFANIARAYAEAVNGGAVPHIDDVWAGVVKAECKVALQSAKQVYMDAMAAVRERLPQEEEDLDRLHNDARSAALQVFATVALGANASELKQQLKASMRDEAAAVAKENRKASKATCKFLLEDIRKNDTRPAYKQEHFFDRKENLENLLRGAQERYFANAVGPAKESRWSHFLLSEIVAIRRALNALRVSEVRSMQDMVEELTTQKLELEATVETQTAELKRLAESSATSSTARHEAEAALAELEAQRDRALDESAAMRGQLTVAKEEAVRQADRIEQLQKIIDEIPPPKSGCACVIQ